MSLKTKFLALILAVAATALLAVTITETVKATVAAHDAAMARQAASVRALGATLDYARDEVTVDFSATGDVTRVAWSAPPAFADHVMIDRVGAATGETATIFVIDRETGEFMRRTTNIVKPDGERAVGTALGKDGAVHPVVASGQTFSGEAVILGLPYYTIYVPIFGAGGEVEGVMYVGARKPDTAAIALASVADIGLSALLALLVAGGLAWVAVGRSLGVIRRMSVALKRIGGGDTRTPVSDLDRRDEIGGLARDIDGLRAQLAASAEARDAAERGRIETLAALDRGIGGVVAAASSGDFSVRVTERPEQPELARLAEGVNAIVETVDRFIEDLGETARAMAEGDLTRPLRSGHPGRLEALSAAINGSLDRLSGLVGRIAATAGVGVDAAGRIASGADELSSRAESQAASLEQTAATMEEMSASVRSNAEALLRADGLAAEVGAKTEAGQRTVAQAVAAVNQIKSGSDQIDEIIAIIESIAFQTNLLALNASVEAARAGEAGRGFAVVASEVRSLAQRTADSARSVSETIRRSSLNVAEGLTKVNETGAALATIRDAARALSTMLRDVAAAGQEQSAGVAQINEAVSQMDRVTQQNAALIGGFSGEARTVSDEMRALIDATAAFRLPRARGIRRAA